MVQRQFRRAKKRRNDSFRSGVIIRIKRIKGFAIVTWWEKSNVEKLATNGVLRSEND